MTRRPSVCGRKRKFTKGKARAMTYSSSDFSDDIFAQLVEVGAIDEEDCVDLEDSASRQADLALAGIARFVEIKEAFVQYRQALKDLAARKGLELQDGVFCEADERAKKALAAIRDSDNAPSLRP